MKRFAKVVVGLPVEGPFDYSIPDELVDFAAIGKRVWVPFKTRELVGYIVGLSDKTVLKQTRPIHSIIDEEPILDKELLELTKWISQYYFCSWGEAIQAVIPGGLKKGKSNIKQRKPSAIGQFKPTRDLKPTVQQDRALRAICNDLNTNTHHVYLLHGITGSGKTEVYLQAIGSALAQGRSSIVLVPEISLTPQAVERFKSRFQEEVAILHSRLTAGERFTEWKKIKEQKARIVVGARSAIFAPLKNIGLIVVDEEHENTYKQQDIPRYHARDVAIYRAKLSKAVVILGSATPSLESYYKAEKNIYKLARLTERIKEKDLPKVEIIDMKNEYNLKKFSIFSKILEENVRDILERGLQAILFLNRRGFSTYMHCKKCGFVLKCKNCSTTLTYHFCDKKLICHWCNYKIAPPHMCPECKSAHINYFGMGTEKVESEMHRLFLDTKIERMDTDTTRKRGSHEKILKDFQKGKIQLLIGTQMIAKGLDYPKVALVGVVSADTALHIPDFRSDERTFSLLTQVAGRAGRGHVQGKVIVQTYTPKHYCIAAASRHDYAEFYKKEILQRKSLKLPPFTHIICITVKGRNHDKTSKEASNFASLLRSVVAKAKSINKKIHITGPAPAIIPRLKMHYRWNVFIRAKDVKDARFYLKQTLKQCPRYSGVRLTIDVDPT